LVGIIEVTTAFLMAATPGSLCIGAWGAMAVITFFNHVEFLSNNTNAIFQHFWFISNRTVLIKDVLLLGAHFGR